jgi:adenine-specific DNA methylase
MPKRYIEDILPLNELNQYAQVGGGIGSLNAMHPYFARRPLTASRAMTLAALIDAPKNDQERKDFEQLLVEISKEEWPNRPDLLEKTRELIRKAHGGQAPNVLDPFAGGGSMPLEALRLGCNATALDLNPVAYLALIGSLVYPQQFGKQRYETKTSPRQVAENGPTWSDEEESTVDEDAAVELFQELAQSKKKTSQSQLVEDVRYWSEWVLSQTEAQIGECYPHDPDGAVPVAYLWAKTIPCPHCGGEIPLIKRRWLQNGRGNEPVAYCLNVNPEARSYHTEILRGQAALDSHPDQGTMRGATLTCIYCNAPLERDRIEESARAGQMGQHLLTIVLGRQGQTGRDFRSPQKTDEQTFQIASEKLQITDEEGFDFWGIERLLSVIPDEPLPPIGAGSVRPQYYGISTWGKMFNDRQILALIIIGQQIRVVRELLHAEEKGYAQAVSLYLSIILSRYITRSSNATIWDPGTNKISSIFARHDIQMTWDYAEANPFSGLASSWKSQTAALVASLDNVITVNGNQVDLRLGSATNLPDNWSGKFDAVICDPPYYDSVTYADLTDYFYPWHKRIVGDDYPEAFVTEVTPKEEELIQEEAYHGGTKSAARKHYEDGMAQAFKEMQRVLRKDGIAVIMFAHKNSSAWETLVGALIRAGFQVTASWPLNTEGRRLQSYRAVALASSVYLVCRKRDNTLGTGYLEDIQNELRKTIRRYLENFWEAKIGGADFFMSAIGPGLSVFSRYKRVERYDGTQVTVGDFIDIVRHEVASFAIERIIGQEGFDDKLDQATQFYVLWRWGYNDWDVPSGEALLLSTAVGIDFKVLIDRFGLIADLKGKLRLLGPQDRKEKLERITERVVAGGAVPLVDVMHKACLLWQNDQQEELSALVAARGGELWPVAQAMTELLPSDNFEKKALLSMLSSRGDLESRAQTWVSKHPAPPPKPKQLSFFDEEQPGETA